MAHFGEPIDVDVRPIRIGDEGQVATRELLARFDAWAGRHGGHGELRARLAAIEALDRQHGGSGPLAVEGLEELVAAILEDLVRSGNDDPDLPIGVALWAIRHEVPIAAVAPVANALAARSNAAAGKPELAAVFGLMQGLVAHVAPRLAADLERSDPGRPWRILHVNLAITAIRTEDAKLLEFAFDALDRALPGECRGFYAEALALALAPGIAPRVREQIEARHLKWTAAS